MPSVAPVTPAPVMAPPTIPPVTPTTTDPPVPCTISGGGETMFGEPQSPVSNRITDHEAGQRWGWYQTIDSYPGGTNSYTFKMWAGAGQYNAANEGVYMGDVVVTVNECQETNGKKSTSRT